MAISLIRALKPWMSAVPTRAKQLWPNTTPQLFGAHLKLNQMLASMSTPNTCLLNTFEKIAKHIGPTLPKRPPNGYMLFVSESSPQIKSSTPNLTNKEIISLIAQRWHSLSQEVKDKYLERAKQESAKYKSAKEKLMKSLTPEELAKLKGQRQLKTKQKARRSLKAALKELDCPARPQSAYNLFVQQFYKDSETLKPLIGSAGLVWKTLSDGDKERYREVAKEDKVRYIEQMVAWKAKLAKPDNYEALQKLIKLKAKALDKGSKVKPTKIKLKSKKRSPKKVLKKATKKTPKTGKSKSKSKSKSNSKSKSKSDNIEKSESSD